MRNICLALLLTFTNSICALAQQQPVQNDSVKVFLDKSLDIIRINSINRDSVNWTELKKQVYQKSLHAQNYEEAALVFPYIFEQIGDHHGALKIGQKSFYWNLGFVYRNKTVTEAVQAHAKVEVAILKGNIGYILVPGNSDFSGKSINLDAEEIRKAIATLNHFKLRGWILDLRVNTGGSMYQMLAGLSGLIGEGKIGSFVNQHGKNDGNWIIRKGNIYLDSNRVSTLKEINLKSVKLLPLAILTSGMTASSGEVVAISTIGRKKSIRIGEKTAGYTTANEGFKINKKAGLNLAVDYDADRNGKIYKSNVVPEILITGGDHFEDRAADEKIARAIKWIKTAS